MVGGPPAREERVVGQRVDVQRRRDVLVVWDDSEGAGGRGQGQDGRQQGGSAHVSPCSGRFLWVLPAGSVGVLPSCRLYSPQTPCKKGGQFFSSQRPSTRRDRQMPWTGSGVAICSYGEPSRGPRYGGSLAWPSVSSPSPHRACITSGSTVLSFPRLPSRYTSFNRRPNKLFRPKRLAISVFPSKRLNIIFPLPQSARRDLESDGSGDQVARCRKFGGTPCYRTAGI